MPRELGQPGVRVDPEYLAAGGLELPRDDAGGNPDVENERSGGRSRNALDQGAGIARPSPVITLRIRSERFRCLALVMRLALGNGRSLR
jgi:hypothetical protein